MLCWVLCRVRRGKVSPSAWQALTLLRCGAQPVLSCPTFTVGFPADILVYVALKQRFCSSSGSGSSEQRPCEDLRARMLQAGSSWHRRIF